ncbi:extracellular solute-binding protein [Paenibacillus chungangensis]|uniref:Extracellular solute-binding protein n=1 Tax=Paenibacillus chungangensis TaxID=696535 RepID=A0ABW3HU79_9BACL
MRNKKKTLSTVLTTLTISAMVVAGCSSNSGNENGGNVKPNNTNKGTGTEASATPKEIGYPEKVSYWVGLNSNAGATMKDYNGIAAYKELEKITGTKVEFQHPPTGQEKDQFNLMIASGKMPDVIEYTWSAAPKGADSLIKEKRIIRLNELIEEHAPYLTKVLNDNPEFRKMITTDEGNIYVMPFLLGDPMLSVFYGPVLRGDWLENLNLEVPKTISEWETVLTAFRDQDPNKNGEKDEIPYLFDIAALDTGQLFLGAWGIMSEFYQVDGKVNYGPIQPEFKEFLETMARWYKEGLIDKEYPTTIDGKLRDAKVTGNRLGSLSTYPGSGIGRYTDLMKGEIPEVSFIGAPYPTLDGGDNAIGFYAHPFRTIGAAISTSAKNPEEIVKWLDYKYSQEGHMLFNFGIEGESYEMVDGYPKYTDLIMNNPDGLPITQAMAQNFIASWSGPMVQDKRYLEQYLQLDTQKEAQQTWAQADHTKLMPPVTLTADESSKVSSIMNDVKTYRDEMINRFIMGEEPIENFDKFVDTINKMNVDEAIAAQQAALDRYKNR